MILGLSLGEGVVRVAIKDPVKETPSDQEKRSLAYVGWVNRLAKGPSLRKARPLPGRQGGLRLC